MGRGMIQLEVVNESMILSGLVGAIVWGLITWCFGLPTSSSHALIGGYAGDECFGILQLVSAGLWILARA
jgi:PiT family inorganic phosphate transporter